MNPKLIVIDGKTYTSVNEMPPDVRSKYEQAMAGLKDENRDGLPDFVENAQPAVVTSLMKFIVDGKEYNGLDDLPPEARARYEQALGTLDKNRNGMPDFMEGMLGIPSQAAAAQEAPVVQTPPPAPASRFPQSAPPAIAPDTSNGWMLVLLGGLLMFLCVAGAAGVWYFFLR